MKLLRQKQVIDATGLSRMTIWRLERAGQFPQRRRLGPNAIGWVENEIDEWIASRPPSQLPCLAPRSDLRVTPASALPILSGSNRRTRK